MKIIACLTLAALALSVAQAAEPFEGKVSMKMTDPKGAAHEMSYTMKAGRLLMSMGAGGQVMTIIINRDQNEMITLMPQQRMYMVRSLTAGPAAAQARAPGNGSLQETGVTDRILGYTCKKYVVKGKDSTTELWLTDQMGSFVGLGSGGRASPPQAWEQALKGKNFFPLRIVAVNAAGHETFRLEVTAIEKQSVDDSVFAVPADWRKIDLGAMMGGMPPLH